MNDTRKNSASWNLASPGIIPATAGAGTIVFEAFRLLVLGQHIGAHALVVGFFGLMALLLGAILMS